MRRGLILLAIGVALAPPSFATAQPPPATVPPPGWPEFSMGRAAAAGIDRAGAGGKPAPVPRRAGRP